MKVLYVSGSGRKNGNTAFLLNNLQEKLGGTILHLADFSMNHCMGCWSCRSTGFCRHDDDMENEIVSELLFADVVVLGSPVYFNNVSSIMKTFMDRTWPLRGKLNNKIGGAIVIGRGYGSESAITAMNSFFLKHDMIPANRGISGEAFVAGEIVQDQRAINDIEKLAKRIKDLGERFVK